MSLTMMAPPTPTGTATAAPATASVNTSSASSVPEGLCVCCQTKKHSANSSTCSKRCEWFLAGRCPQCGRSRRPDKPFCGKACASHSVHANWCPVCTVNQCAAGRQYCSDQCAQCTEPVIDRPRKRNETEAATHVLLPPDDREAVMLVHMLNGVQVAGVVRLAHNPARRRQYLNYRAVVERRMSQLGQSKYGHGGEGNEHKRFTPVAIKCAMSPGPDGTISPCVEPSCEACGVLRHGFSLQAANMLSHYCMATGDVAASWAPVHPTTGQRAIVVSRAVVGNPQFIANINEIQQPWLLGFDSCIVTNGDATFDGTYLFSDDAIEALYIVLCS